MQQLENTEKKYLEAIKLIQTIHKIELQTHENPYGTGWTHRDRKAISQLIIQMCEDFFREIKNDSNGF